MDWVPVKDLKDRNPNTPAKYAIANIILEELAFAWWVSFCLNKQNRITSKIKSKYWQTTHKYGIRLPKMVEEAL